MSIFDGYENKSPEELAKKLGISDLSVVDNANKKISGTIASNFSLPKEKIKSDPMNSFLKLRESEIKDDTLWSSQSTYIEEGMRIKYKGIGKIKSLHSEGIAIVDYGSDKTETIDFNRKNTKILKHKKDGIIPNIIEIEESWLETHLVPKFELKDLERNIRFKNRGDDKFGRIMDVNGDKIKVRLNGEIKIFDYSKFREIVRLYKEDYDKVKIDSLSHEGIWINEFSIETLKKGMYIKNNKGKGIYTKNNEGLYIIEKIDPKTSEIRIKTGYCTSIVYKKKDFIDEFAIFIGDTKAEKLDDNLWTSYYLSKDIKKLEKFLEIGSNTTGTILEIIKKSNTKLVKIKLDGDTKEITLSINQFQNTCKLSKQARTPFIGLDNRKLRENINSWKYMYNMNEVGKGARILHIKSSKIGKIIEDDYEKREISIVLETGEKKTIKRGKFQEQYAVFKEDYGYTDIDIGPINIGKATNWSRIDKNSKLKRGMIIKNSENILYWITDINYEDILLTQKYTVPTIEYSIDSLSDWYLYKKETYKLETH